MPEVKELFGRDKWGNITIPPLGELKPVVEPTKPEPWGGRTDFSDEYTSYGGGTNPLYGGSSTYDVTTRKPTTSRTTPTSSRTLSTADRPSMDSYSSYKPAISSTSSAAPIPYGQRTSWEPGAGTTMPTIGAMPEYMMPEIDRGRISELQELSMGAPMGKLRRGLSETALGTRSIENPNVRAQMLRNLMSGYGEGVSDIRAGAGREAMSMYMPEFQAAGQKAQAEYQTGVSGVMAQFQADLGDYMKRGSQVTTPVQGRYEGSTRKPITWGAPKLSAYEKAKQEYFG